MIWYHAVATFSFCSVQTNLHQYQEVFEVDLFGQGGGGGIQRMGGRSWKARLRGGGTSWSLWLDGLVTSLWTAWRVLARHLPGLKDVEGATHVSSDYKMFDVVICIDIGPFFCLKHLTLLRSSYVKRVWTTPRGWIGWMHLPHQTPRYPSECHPQVWYSI